VQSENDLVDEIDLVDGAHRGDLQRFNKVSTVNHVNATRLQHMSELFDKRGRDGGRE